MDEPIKPTTIRTLGSFSGRFGAPPAGGAAPTKIDTGDKVKLKSSGDLTAEIASLAAAVQAAAAKPIAADPNQPLYRVRSGDSLSMIAAATLGDASRWPEIAALNIDQYPSLKHNPALIREGWTLQMPAFGDAGDDQPERVPHGKPAKAPSAPKRREPAPAYDPPPPAPTQQVQDDCPPKGKPAKPVANDTVAAAATDYIKGAHVGRQSSKVTGMDTETDTAWDVSGDGAAREATVTAQKTKVTAADTRTNTHWEKPAAPAAKAPGIQAKVPVSLDGVLLKPGANDQIASQKTHVTGADTVTDSHWNVDGDQQELTAQKTQVIGADTHTDTIWKRAPQGGEAVQEPIQQGIRVPVSLKGLKLEPGQNAEIESQETIVDEIDTATDTHWNVNGDQAEIAKQKTNVTGAETITRTRWKVTGLPVPPAPTPVAPPVAPPKPHLCNEAEAVAWLQAHLDANGRISRDAIAGMPDGPGKDALLEHFDALLFGYIDPGQQGWVQLHRGDVDALAQALADGGSIKGFAGQLTRKITAERGVGDLNRDGQVNEADLAAYAARLRGGQPYEPVKPAPVKPAPTNAQERLQHDLQVYLDDRNNQGADPVLSLLDGHAKYIEAASPTQKAELVWRLVDGNPGDDRRNAALQILEVAGTRKELTPTLDALGQRKKGMDTLLNRLGDNDQGKELAHVLLAHDLYKNPLVWQHMDDDATVSLCEALGFKHPMVGTSDELLALSDEARNHMMKQLTGGNVTWTELYMAQWINQHNQIPYHIPDNLTENRNGGRR